jgi:hypothetical protein
MALADLKETSCVCCDDEDTFGDFDDDLDKDLGPDTEEDDDCY